MRKRPPLTQFPCAVTGTILGKIGIFWFFAGRVWGQARPISEGEERVAGLRDSPDTHAEFWERPAGEIVLPWRDQPYFTFPRGRVLYRECDGRFLVYMDRALFTRVAKAAIRTFFTLVEGSVVWCADPHYTTDPEELDRLFSE